MKKLTTVKRIEKLEREVGLLGAEPDILALNPREDYIFIFPEKTPEEEMQSYVSKFVSHPNILVVAADHLKVIEIK